MSWTLSLFKLKWWLCINDKWFSYNWTCVSVSWSRNHCFNCQRSEPWHRLFKTSIEQEVTFQSIGSYPWFTHREEEIEGWEIHGERKARVEKGETGVVREYSILYIWTTVQQNKRFGQVADEQLASLPCRKYLAGGKICSFQG